MPAAARKKRLLLLVLFLASAASSIVRCRPPTLMHPVLGGPRYFFFPFVLLVWFWIDALVSARPRPVRLLAGAVLALLFFSTSTVFNRRHDHLDWRGAARELRVGGRALLPVHYDGVAGRRWTVRLRTCGDKICSDP